MARHIRKGDLVEVVTGDDRGKKGRVLRVMPKDQKVTVEGVNYVYRHMRRSRQNPSGGRVQREAPIDISNVQPVSPKTDRGTRVRFERRASGEKERVAVACGTSLGSVRQRKSR